jgi:hypothetical protein
MHGFPQLKHTRIFPDAWRVWGASEACGSRAFDGVALDAIVNDGRYDGEMLGAATHETRLSFRQARPDRIKWVA